MDKYEPTNAQKRRILFNRELEESYQNIRKNFRKMENAPLTEEEQEQWIKYKRRNLNA